MVYICLVNQSGGNVEDIYIVAASRALQEMPDRIAVLLDQAGITATTGDIEQAIEQALHSRYAPIETATVYYTILSYDASA
jgi:hypothetical protein